MSISSDLTAFKTIAKAELVGYPNSSRRIQLENANILLIWANTLENSGIESEEI